MKRIAITSDGTWKSPVGDFPTPVLRFSGGHSDVRGEEKEKRWTLRQAQGLRRLTLSTGSSAKKKVRALKSKRIYSYPSALILTGTFIHHPIKTPNIAGCPLFLFCPIN
jgi:hypothetical protein